MARNKPKEELRATVELNLSGRKLEYALAAILGISGYGVYNINGSGEEISRLDKQHVVKLESRLDALESKLILVSREISIVSVMLSKENRKAIEKVVQ